MEGTLALEPKQSPQVWVQTPSSNSSVTVAILNLSEPAAVHHVTMRTSDNTAGTYLILTALQSLFSGLFLHHLICPLGQHWEGSPTTFLLQMRNLQAQQGHGVCPGSHD